MLHVIAFTRPMRSPSQPKTSPPAAAPSRKSAVTMPIQDCTNFSSAIPAAACICCSAGRATSGKMPISIPSNIQPRNAAVMVMNRARDEMALAAGIILRTGTTSPATKATGNPIAAATRMPLKVGRASSLPRADRDVRTGGRPDTSHNLVPWRKRLGQARCTALP